MFKEKDSASDNPHYLWLNAYMQSEEMEEVRKHIKTKHVRDLLVQGNFFSTKEAFGKVCLMMNSRNTKKRQKWNFLADDHPNKWAKGRSLLQKLNHETNELLDKQEEEDGKKTPLRITRSKDKQASTRAETSQSKSLKNTSVKSSPQKTLSSNSKNIFTNSCKNEDNFYNSLQKQKANFQKPKIAKNSPIKSNLLQMEGTARWIDDEVHQVMNPEHLIEKESVYGSQEQIQKENTNQHYQDQESSDQNQIQDSPMIIKNIQRQSAQDVQQVSNSSQQTLFSQDAQQATQSVQDQIKYELEAFRSSLQRSKEHKENFLKLVNGISQNYLKSLNEVEREFEEKNFQSPSKRQRKDD